MRWLCGPRLGPGRYRSTVLWLSGSRSQLRVSGWMRLGTDRMIFGVGIGAPGSYDVANPAERAASPDPEARSDNQPENAGKYTAVVELAYSRDNKTQDTRQKWIAHGQRTSVDN